MNHDQKMLDNMHRVPPLQIFKCSPFYRTDEGKAITTAEALSEWFDAMVANAKQSKQPTGKLRCLYVISADSNDPILFVSSQPGRLNHNNLAETVTTGGMMFTPVGDSPGSMGNLIKVNDKERRIHFDSDNFSHKPTGLQIFTNLVLYLRALNSDRDVLLIENSKGQLEDHIKFTASLDYIYRLSPLQARVLYGYGFGDYPKQLELIVDHILEENVDDDIPKILTVATDLLVSQLGSIDPQHWALLKAFSSQSKQPALKNEREVIQGYSDSIRATIEKGKEASKPNLFKKAAEVQKFLLTTPRARL